MPCFMLSMSLFARPLLVLLYCRLSLLFVRVAALGSLCLMVLVIAPPSYGPSSSSWLSSRFLFGIVIVFSHLIAHRSTCVLLIVVCQLILVFFFVCACRLLLVIYCICRCIDCRLSSAFYLSFFFRLASIRLVFPWRCRRPCQASSPAMLPEKRGWPPSAKTHPSRCSATSLDGGPNGTSQLPSLCVAPGDPLRPSLRCGAAAIHWCLGWYAAGWTAIERRRCRQKTVSWH